MRRMESGAFRWHRLLLGRRIADFVLRRNAISARRDADGNRRSGKHAGPSNGLPFSFIHSFIHSFGLNAVTRLTGIAPVAGGSALAGADTQHQVKRGECPRKKTAITGPNWRC
jgi:hypothetical protein